MKNTKYIIAFRVFVFLTTVFFFAAGCDDEGQPGSVESPRSTSGAEPNVPAGRIEVAGIGPAESNAAKVSRPKSAEPNIVEVSKTKSAEPNVVEVPKGELTEPDVVKTVCHLIYEGKFEAAGELVQQRLGDVVGSISGEQKGRLGRLAEIAEEYKGIGQRRQQAGEAAYKEQLAKLEEFQADADTKDTGGTDVNDVNETGRVIKVLSVIAGAREFADEQQKQELLSDAFVKQVFQEAIDKAAGFESKGKWLQAYTNCYMWLKAIDPDNEVYSEHADQLYEKANIMASFQDSPCETRQERFEGVEKKMFVRAIDTLKYNYVSSIIGYREMATKAVKRCKLLAEVIAASEVLQDELSVEPEEFGKKSAAWSAALAAILDEVNTPTGISKDKFIDVFEKVQSLNRTTLELPEQMLIAQFAEAALSALDPHTVMVWPRQAPDFEKMMTNEFPGIGIEITKEKGLLTVASLLPDTPAYNSDLDAGDVIEAVDGVDTSDMSLACAVKNITGPAGTKVKLTVRSPGEEHTRDITITRARITVPPIRGWQRTEAGKWLYIIDEANKIGYVRITGFSPITASVFEKTLTELEAEGLKGLILDLRFNVGGLLDSAIEVSDKFIKEGLIVSTHPRRQMPKYVFAHRAKTHPNYPLVVLINRYSASASEIVAGALADKAHNRAILVGERTHGKGSVQGITHYPGGGAQLKYTMAYYHLPSGGRVESQEAMKKQGRKDWGVGPNVGIRLRSDELRKMSDVRRDNDVLVKADHDREDVSLKKHAVGETLAADPQLAVAVLVVKTELIEAESAGCELVNERMSG